MARCGRLADCAAVLAAAALATVALASNPCAEPGAKCPDLVMRRPSEMHLLKHRYLASTNQIVNVGDGPMQVNAHRVSSARMHARLIVRRAWQWASCPVSCNRSGCLRRHRSRQSITCAPGASCVFLRRECGGTRSLILRR